MIDWDDLQTFLAIAREGSLSAAAKTLNTTQPTMGRRLAKMENDLGARLLERHPKGFSLTTLGEQILANVERIEAEVLNAEILVKGRDIALEGVIRVTSVDVITTKILVPAVKNLRDKHPKIHVELLPDSRTLNLTRREADIAVRLSRPEQADLICKKLGVLETNFFASKKYLEKYGDPNINGGLNHQLICVLDDQSHLLEAKALVDAFPNAEIAMKTNSRETMFSACELGLGIVSVPKIRCIGNNELVEIKHPSNPIGRDVWLAVHQDLRKTPRIRAMIEAIEAEFTKLKKNQS